MMSDTPLIANRYRLETIIGEGGMGKVYRALDTRLNRQVAIKQLKSDLVASDPGMLERFKREAQALRRLNHPNIVRVMGLLSEDDQHYIIMEYVAGGSLMDKVAVEPLPIKRTLEIALELADALARAHHLNIIHRDIKPANILLADDGTPRLTDFGVAHIGDRSRVTEAQTVLGTLAYLSPEALDGKELDPRADIWSFGVLIYKMLTGALPFDDTSSSGTIMAIFNQPMPSVREVRSDVPQSLVTLISHMLEKDRDKRIFSARLVGAELQAILQGQTITVTMPVSSSAEATGEVNAGLVHQLVNNLLMMGDKWNSRLRDSEALMRKVQDGQTLYFHRAVVDTYRKVIAELNEMLEQSKEIVNQPVESYAEVSRAQVEALLKQLNLRFTDLYEDTGYVFSVVFPKIGLMSLNERLEKLTAAAPQIVILDSGRLSDTGESYVDFAFELPLE